MQDTAKRDFDGMSTTWDDEPRRLKLAGDIAKTIKDHLPLNRSITLLDYGCGTGLVSLHLSDSVKSITGLDSSKGMLDTFRKKIESAGITSIKLKQIPDDGIAEISGSYDLIVSTMTLHHIPDPTSLINNLTTHLAPGGHLCIADLDREDGSFHDSQVGIMHFGFDRAVIKQWMTGAGLVDITDCTASVVEKIRADASLRYYPVFLVYGEKV